MAATVTGDSDLLVVLTALVPHWTARLCCGNIELMFDTLLDELDAVRCSDALAETVVEQRRVGARRLALVAHWADLHTPSPQTRLRSRCARGGSDGTPEVTEFTATELGVLLGTTTISASNLLRDTLDLRHRHPLLWEAVMTGQVEDWKARKVAATTARLPHDQARWVDGVTVEAVVALPFGRAMAVVEAKVVAADPDAEERRRRNAADELHVTVGPSRENGLRTLSARTTAGQAARIDAMITHLAALLPATEHQAGPSAGRRRAEALALLANPAQACLLLAATLSSATSGSSGSDAGELEPPLTHPADPADSCAPTAVELAAAFGQALTALAAERGEGAAWDRLRPRTLLYVHLAEEAITRTHQCATCAASEIIHGPASTQVARVEGIGPAAGPMLTTDLRTWLHTEHLTVQPVLDPQGARPVDAYEVPSHLREALTLLHPHEVFPYGTLQSRSADLDHTLPWVSPEEGGPPDQTGLANLGPLNRTHHRAKTFGGFHLHQPAPGMYLWRTPTGHWHQVDHRGTHYLGRATPSVLEQLDGAHEEMSQGELALRDALALAA